MVASSAIVWSLAARVARAWIVAGVILAAMLARLASFVVLVASGCGVPRDPDGTLERVRGGVLRVGVVDAPPWVIFETGQPPRGREVLAATRLAGSLGADVAWVAGGETRLMAAMQAGSLDLVIGGLIEDSPYRDEVGLTRAYLECDDGEHVFAGPPGENRWLMTVEAFLADAGIACAGPEPAP